MRAILAVYHFAQAHPVMASGVGCAIFSNIADLLNEPTDTSSKAYRMFYKLMHGLALNWKTAITA